MPIYRDDAGALVVHMGRGDIHVSRGHLPDAQHDDELMFAQQEPHPIGGGDPSLIGKRSDEIGVQVRLYFERVASLDVVMAELTALREALKGAEAA